MVEKVDIYDMGKHETPFFEPHVVDAIIDEAPETTLDSSRCRACSACDSARLRLSAVSRSTSSGVAFG